jgi:uncharacterized protein with FMN-binding domain
MRRITFWFLSTLSVVVLLFGYDGSKAGSTATVSPPGVLRSGSTSTGEASTSTNGASSASTRIVDGSVASTQWGPVQVELTIRGSTITDVRLLQQPSGNPRDDEINSYAVPKLTQETEDAQGADIDMVTGATVTSTGYIQSLQSAIDRAGL